MLATVEAGQGEGLRFEVQDVEVEMQVVVSKGGEGELSGEGGVKLWVLAKAGGKIAGKYEPYSYLEETLRGLVARGAIESDCATSVGALGWSTDRPPEAQLGVAPEKAETLCARMTPPRRGIDCMATVTGSWIRSGRDSDRLAT